MIEVCNIHVMKPLLESHGFHFSKAKGQNFLIAPWVPESIVREAGVDKCAGVLEIGPGIGPLTQQLCLGAKKVCAVELDNRLKPILDATVGEFDNLEIIWNDVLKLDVPSLVQEKFPGLRPAACANLPYYITSPIIMMLLEERLPIDSITVMVQKEAAQRICAEVGTRQSGAVTVAVNYYSTPQLLFSVSAGSFMPAPKVDSAVIRLDILENSRVQLKNEKLFFRIIKSAFGQRRKTLSNSLSSGLSLPKGDVINALEIAGVPANYRAEQLTMQQLADIANAIAQITE